MMAALVLPSCSESWQPEIETTGSVALGSLGVDVDKAEKVIPDSRASVDLSSFIITVRNSRDEIKGEWTYSKMPEILTLPVGAYTVDVVSHNEEKAAWDAPLFKGSKSFQIEDSKITDIGVVTCLFSNIKVTIEYSDDLTPLLGDDVKVTVVANDEGTLVFDKNETRAGYFQALDRSTTLVATFTGSVAGYNENLRIVLNDVEAGQHRKITYKIKDHKPDMPDETGGIENPGVEIDATVITDDINSDAPAYEEPVQGDRPGKEDPEKPGDDDPVKPDDPADDSIVIAGQGDFNINEVNVPEDGKTYAVDITSKLPLAHIYVRIDSQTLPPEELAGIGLTDYFDLAEPGDLVEGLTSLGFPYGDKVKGQTSVTFDISQFIPMLNILGTGESNFILTVEDESGNSKTQTLTFKVY